MRASLRHRAPALCALALLASLASAGTASADVPCGAVELRFQPGAPNLQIAVWIEDSAGHYVDTAYLTRVTGQFGLGNRPGSALLKTDFGWPYGRREMVLPIWAHRRNHHYPKVTMGGVCGNSTTTMCPWGVTCGGDCDDTTIAYHSLVSSYEPFYCSPQGASALDALSCASKGTFSKGAYADAPAYSLYPPRADISKLSPNDGQDLLDFAVENDVVAISQATPPSGQLIDPPVDWFPPNIAYGDYVAFVELSQESDFNGAHNHPNQPDSQSGWDFEGHAFLGQPSVIYQVPFHYGPYGSSATTGSYAGYSTWDGSDGTLHPADGTITTNVAGSGAGRLTDVNDGVDLYRVKVVVGQCEQPPVPDMSVPRDLLTPPPPDLAMQKPRDFSLPRDLSTPRDLVAAHDLSKPRDLSTATARDLSSANESLDGAAPDLAVSDEDAATDDGSAPAVDGGPDLGVSLPLIDAATEPADLTVAGAADMAAPLPAPDLAPVADAAVADLASAPDLAGAEPPADAALRDLASPAHPTCLPPDPATHLTLEPGATSITVRFTTPTSGPAAARYAVKYHEATTPITDAMFDTQLSAPNLSAAAAGTTLSTTISSLVAGTSYAVAVRGVSACNQPSAVVSTVISTTAQKFATLNGCFIATAAYGSPLEGSVGALRRFRDRHLLDNPMGQLFVAHYYAFSPVAAAAIARDPGLRALSRAALDPLVQLVERVAAMELPPSLLPRR